MRRLALLSLALLTSGGASEAVRAPIPALPDSVYSQVGWIPVKRVAGLRCGGEVAYGCFIASDMTIYVRDSIAPNLAAQTLEHELVHVDLFLGGISLGQMEDHVADVLASARVGRAIHSPMLNPLH